MQGGITLEGQVALGAPCPGPASRGSHLLPECTVVTVVGLGLRSDPTPETPEEEETRLQSVEGTRRTIFLAGQAEAAGNTCI